MALERIPKFIISALFGGTTGQVLKKNSATDGDYTWANPAEEVPPGGATGTVLTKDSAADGDYSWAAVPNVSRVVAAGRLTDSTVDIDLHNTINSVVSYNKNTTGTGGVCTWEIQVDLPYVLSATNFIVIASGKGMTFDSADFVDTDSFYLVGRYTDDAYDATAMTVSFTVITTAG